MTKLISGSKLLGASVATLVVAVLLLVAFNTTPAAAPGPDAQSGVGEQAASSPNPAATSGGPNQTPASSVIPATPKASEPVPTHSTVMGGGGGLVIGLPGFDPGEPLASPASEPCDPETEDCG